MAHKMSSIAKQKTLDLDDAGNLKIGDIVLFYYNARKRHTTDSADKSGFILADLSGSHSRQLLTIQPTSHKGHVQQLPNVQFATFKVLAWNKQEAQTRYRELYGKLKELKRKKTNQKAIEILQLQVTQAKRDCQMEMAENTANQQQLQGSSVSYGDSVQLLHTMTSKYLCVSSTETSVTENTKLKVHLQRKDSIGCIFRLHPHIKMKTVGEEVNYTDYVKFESVSTEGQFLHCSRKTFRDLDINVNSQCFELNLSAKESPLKIIRHYRVAHQQNKHSENRLKGSSIVRFFHRKHQCYIVGEGSFAGQYASLPELTDNETRSRLPTSSSIQSIGGDLLTLSLPGDYSTFEVSADVEPVADNSRSPISDHIEDKSIASSLSSSTVDLGESPEHVPTKLSSSPKASSPARKVKTPPSPSFKPQLIGALKGTLQLFSGIGKASNPPARPATPPIIEVHEESTSESDSDHEKEEMMNIPSLPIQDTLEVNDAGDQFRKSVSLPEEKSESCFIEDYVISEDVHFKRKQRLGGIICHPSTSPNTFWQIEKYNEPYSGEPIHWAEQCKIKHLPSRRYLAVTGTAPNYKVTLKSKDLEPNASVFELCPAIQRIEGEISYDVILRVRHAATNTWLHLSKDKKYPSDGNGHDDENDTDKDNVESFNERYQVIATVEINSDDAFTLEKVEEDLVVMFNYMAGISSVLTDQLKQCELLMDNKPHSIEDCHMGPSLSTLLYLKDLLEKNTDRNALKIKQKFIRGLKIMELVTQLLTLHKDEKGNDQEVCTACFGVISSFLEGNSSKNKTYISKMIHHIFTPSVWETKLIGGETVEKAHIGIAKDNPSLLYDIKFTSRVSWHLVQKLLTMDKNNDRVIQLLEGLSVLCACKGVPIKQNQLAILKHLQCAYNGGDMPCKMFYPLRLKPLTGADIPETGARVNFFGLETDEFDHTIIEMSSRTTTPTHGNQTVKHIVQYQAMPSSDKTTHQSGHWYNLYNLSRGDVARGDKIISKFLLAQLQLLVMMCKGNNKDVIDVLRGVPGTQTFGVEISFPIIIGALNDDSLKKSLSDLRGALVDLLKVMFVEVGGNRPVLENFPLSFNIYEVDVPSLNRRSSKTMRSKVTALTGVENSNFPVIHQWIASFLQEVSEYTFAADESDNNEVVLKVLQLLAVLVKYGYYDDANHVKDVVPSLYKLLDGSRDYPTEQVKQFVEKNGQHQQQDRTTSFGFSRKHLTWRPYTYRHPRRPKATAIWSHGRKRNRSRLITSTTERDPNEAADVSELTPEKAEKLLIKFREGGGRYKYIEMNHNHYEIKHWALEIIDLFFNLQMYKCLNSFIYDYRWLSSQKIVEDMPSEVYHSEELDRPKNMIEEIIHLLDTNPRDPQFLKDSPNLAKKIFSAARNYLKLACHQKADLDLRNCNQLPHILLDLANYECDDLIQYSIKLLDRCYTFETDILQKALQIQLLNHQKSVMLYNTVEHLVVPLVAYLSIGTDDSGEEDVSESSPIKALTDFCWLEGEVEGYEPHEINQNIIISFGILHDVLNYVTQYCTGSCAAYHCKNKLVECFLLLRALACKHEVVKNMLLKHVEQFLNVSSCSHLGPHIGALLREIFRGEPSISLSVSEDQIMKIMQAICSKKKEMSTQTNAALVDALQELLMVRNLDLPLKHNQMIVVRNFSLMREDDRYWCKDLISEGKSDLRMKILTANDDSDPQLSCLLVITDLLATCAFGKSAGADSICFTIYSEDEIFEIISSKDISLYRKRPFMKFFVCVHMDILGPMVETRGQRCRKSKLLWDHMSDMASLLDELSKGLKNVTHSSYLSIKEVLIDSSWKYLHECLNRKHLQSPPPLEVMDDQGNQHQFEISDVIFYLIEAYLPFLQIFFGEFYTKSYNRRQHHFERNIIHATYKALLAIYSHVCSKSKRVYFPQDTGGITTFLRALLTIKPHASCELINELQDIEDDIVNRSYIFEEELISEARERYNEIYKEEIELNSNFRRFVRNYKAAFEGRNTRRAQILDSRNKRNVSDKERYSDYLDDEMTKPGVKYLPLGLDFQEQVSLFRKSDSVTHGDVKINPKERLLKQLELSLIKAKSGKHQNNNSDLERQTEIDVKCLQILRASIYNKIILINEEDKEREPKKYRKQCELLLHPVQDEIQDLGNAIVRVMPLLSHPNEEIVKEVPAILEALLEFGNRHVQQGLQELLRSHDHQIFQILQTMLRRAALLFKQGNHLITLHKAMIKMDEKILEKAEIINNDVFGEDKNSDQESVHDIAAKVATPPKHAFVLTKFRKKDDSKNLTMKTGEDRRVPFLAIYRRSRADDDIDEKVSDFFQFCDISQFTLIIKVLGLMCDGQNREMQNFLREQSESLQSINMVGEIATFLYDFSEKRLISFSTLPLLIEILNTLVEICVGNYKNHEVVFSKHILSVINYILHIDITDINEQGDQITRATTARGYYADTTKGKRKSDYVSLRIMGLKLKASAIELLEVMMEDISTETKKLSRQIAGGLDISSLQWSMVDFFVLMNDKELIREFYDDNASRALSKTYKILLHLHDTGMSSLESLKPTEKNGLKAWDFCEKKFLSIEVVYRDQDNAEELLTRVHFDPHIKTEIKEHLKDSIKYKVNRNSHRDKLRDFHDWMEAAKKDTMHYDWLKKKKLNIFTAFSKQRYWFLLLLTVLLNFITIAAYRETLDQFNLHSIGSIITVSEFQIVFYVLGGVHLVFTQLMLLEYFIVTWPHFVLPEFLYKIRLIPRRFRHYRLTAWLTKIRILPRFDRTYSSVNIIGLVTIYLIAFDAFSVVSLLFYGILYSGCLFYIVINNDILQRALKSVTQNWKSLFWVAMLLLVLTFIYALATFLFYHREFNATDNLFCRNLGECFVSVLRFGLIDNFLEVPFNTSADFPPLDTQIAGRLFYDIIFFILVTTIGLNIVFGIIVDTFSELRDERFNAENDMKSNCFICNLPGHAFEKLSNQGFEDHVAKDHNMWAYIYYSIYLDLVDISDHNAIEKYVYDKINAGDIDYLPFKKALVLEGKEDESKELKKEMEELREEVRNRFDALEALMRSRNEH